MPTIPTPPEGIDAQLAEWRAAGIDVRETAKPVGYSLTVKKKTGPKKMPSKLVESAFESGAGPLEFTIPLNLESPNKGGHAVKRWMFGQAAKHRRVVFEAFARQIVDVAPFVRMAQEGRPVRCVIIRLGRILDDDNLAGSAKQLRDAVAQYHGVGDGLDGPIRWEYRQEKRAYDGLRIRLETCPETQTADLPF